MEPSNKDALVSCACWNDHYSMRWKKCGFLMIVLSILMTTAILLPYTTSMVLQKMPAFLPYISQAGGSPPMTGTLTVPLIVTAFMGFISFVLLYESLNHRNIKQKRLFTWANKLALATIILCCVGCLAVGSNPVGYTEGGSKLDWILTVGLEHGMGALMVVIGTAFYQYLLAFLWYHLPDASTKQKCLKYAFAVSYILAFIAIAKPFPDHVVEEVGPEIFNFELLRKSTYNLPKVFTVNYQISAFCEWFICILSVLNFLSLFPDFQRISFRLTIRHKSCYKETAENPPPTICTLH